jgi:hypothetical protein
LILLLSTNGQRQIPGNGQCQLKAAILTPIYSLVTPTGHPVAVFGNEAARFIYYNITYITNSHNQSLSKMSRVLRR